MSEHTEAVKAAADYLTEWMPRCSHESPTDMLWLTDHVVAVADRFGGGMTKEQLRGEVVFLNRIVADLRDAAREVVEAARRAEDRMGGVPRLELAIDALREALDA